MYKKNHHPHERPLAKNPNKITVNQHVIPQAHLKEWSRQDGLLNVFDKQKRIWFTPHPRNAFTVQRIWNQSAEKNLLGTNERNYQSQAKLIKESLPIEYNDRISEYFIMLCIRADVARKERPVYPSIMVPCSKISTQCELEINELENACSSVHIILPSDDKSQDSARTIVTGHMNMRFIKEFHKFHGMTWTPFAMKDEDAILPDSLSRLYTCGLAILPINPKIVLIGSGTKDRIMDNGELTSATINKLLRESSVRYYVSSSQVSD